MTAVPSPRKQDVFEGDNYEPRVVSTLELFGLERPREVPFLLQLFFGHAKKS